MNSDGNQSVRDIYIPGKCVEELKNDLGLEEVLPSRSFVSNLGE